MSYTVRSKHKLLFSEKSGKKYLGDVLSLSDSSDLRISGELCIHATVKYEQFKSYQSCRCFYILAPPEKEPSGEITKIFKFLHEFRGKCMQVYFDSAGSSCLLGLPEPYEESAIGGRGFKCYIVDLKKRPPPPMQSSLPPPTPMNQQALAATHYNDLERDQATRHTSQIYHMRKLNNYIKDELISQAGEKVIVEKSKESPGVRVIDFGCGMGGDIFKWFKNSRGLARYVGVDIAQNSLVKFVGRLTENKSRVAMNRVTHLIHADIGSESLGSSILPVHTWKTDASGNSVGSWSNAVPLTEADVFDVASCQFAMHYMFQTEAKAHHFFDEISRRLKPGGIFIATTIDCRVIAELLGELTFGKSQLTQPTAGAAAAADAPAVTDPKKLFALMQQRYDEQKTTTDKTLEIRNDLGLTILSVTFSEEMCRRLIGSASVENKPPEEEDSYGIQYTFTLQDDAKSSAVNAPEWIVPQGAPLRALAEAHDMEVLQVTNFQEMIYQQLYLDFERDKNWNRMENMGIFNYKGSISAAEWSVMRLYTAMVFQKKGDPGSNSMAPLFGGNDKSRPSGNTNGGGGGGFAPSSPSGPPPPVPLSSTASSYAAAAASFGSFGGGGAGGGFGFAPSSPSGPPPPFNSNGFFAPSSPDGPPPPSSNSFSRFAPSSPSGPPPPLTSAVRFAPSTPPTGPPPRYAPSSPEGPPPSKRSSGFVPSSPEGPPPTSRGHAFAPSSPAGPPPPPAAGRFFVPTSPTGPPPPHHPTAAAAAGGRFNGGYVPSSPEGPPPQAAAAAASGGRFFAPSSPTGPPPPLTGPRYAPSSPEGPPPPKKIRSKYDSDDEDDAPQEEEDDMIDPSTLRLLRLRECAIALAGGEEVWDSLDEESIERFMERAERQLSEEDNGGTPAGGVGGVDRQVSDLTAPSSMSPSDDGFGQYTDEMEEELLPDVNSVGGTSRSSHEENEAVQRMLKIRTHAVKLAGGEEAWDRLEESERQLWLRTSEEAHEGGCSAVFPPSLSFVRRHDESPASTRTSVSRDHLPVAFNPPPMMPLNRRYESDSDFERSPQPPPPSSETPQMEFPSPVMRRMKSKYDSDSEEEGGEGGNDD